MILHPQSARGARNSFEHYLHTIFRPAGLCLAPSVVLEAMGCKKQVLSMCLLVPMLTPQVPCVARPAPCQEEVAALNGVGSFSGARSRAQEGVLPHGAHP